VSRRHLSPLLAAPLALVLVSAVGIAAAPPPTPPAAGAPTAAGTPPASTKGAPPTSAPASGAAPASAGGAAPAPASAGTGPPPSPVAPSETGSPLKPGEKLKMKSVRLHVFHRVFRNFHDQVEARLKQEFRIGDSDYTGVITEFVPDFAMGLESHKVMTRSQEPNNPAFHIVVRKNGVPVDTTWAFLDMPPHFTRRALVAFIATRVTFENHPTVTSRDSLAIRLMQSEAK